MTRPSITLRLPERRGGAWADSVLYALRPAIARLAEPHGLAAPTLVVLRGDRPPAVILGEAALRLPESAAPGRMAEAFASAIAAELWHLLLVPALAERGIDAAASLWLRVAAARGLALDAIERLAAGGADETAIAWRLAALPPPTPRLLVARAADAAAYGEEERRAAARRAAAWVGLPVPLPPPPMLDPTLDPDEEDGMPVLALGLRRMRLRTRSALDEALAAAAGCLIDPALALALATDRARLSRRLAVRALAGDGAVALAEAMLRAQLEGRWPVDLVGPAEAVAQLAPVPAGMGQ